MMTGTNTSMKKSHITAISGLKVLAVAGIIVCHMGLAREWGFCARMVEMLFIISGFLMAYNYFEKDMANTLGEGVRLIGKKLPHIYPVHLITFLLQLFFVATWAQKPLEYIISLGFLNLSLMHAWFPGTQFIFNNVSWFLSALVFCYFITPSLLGTIKYAMAKRRLVVLFLLIIAIRLYIEYLVEFHHRELYMDMHTNPLVQSLNYSLGFIAGVWFLRSSVFNDFMTKLSKIEMSVLEMLIMAFYLTLCYTLEGYAWRGFFVLMAIPVVYVFAFNKGGISKVLSMGAFRFLSTMTLEIFMFHSFLLYHYPTDINDAWYYVKFCALVLVISMAWHYGYAWVRGRVFAKK